MLLGASVISRRRKLTGSLFFSKRTGTSFDDAKLSSFFGRCSRRAWDSSSRVVADGLRFRRVALLHPGILAAWLAVGLLSSIIPYTLELEALRRVPARVFGIWMSLEPAVAALVGLTMLGQALAVSEWAAIVCVMVACAGAARGSARSPQAPQA